MKNNNRRQPSSKKAAAKDRIVRVNLQDKVFFKTETKERMDFEFIQFEKAQILEEAVYRVLGNSKIKTRYLKGNNTLTEMLNEIIKEVKRSDKIE